MLAGLSKVPVEQATGATFPPAVKKAEKTLVMKAISHIAPNAVNQASNGLVKLIWASRIGLIGIRDW